MSSPMVIPLKEVDRYSSVSRHAKDFPSCTECSGCRPDITTLTAVTGERRCCMCNQLAKRKCSRCKDGDYCSTKCQKADWPTHKLLCKEYASVQGSARSSPKHYRAILFPCEAAPPTFVWVEMGDADKLLVRHAAVDEWMANNGSGGGDEASLVVHALSQDMALQSKRMGHALKIAAYPPPSGEYGWLKGFNETVFDLARWSNPESFSGLYYGPVIGFAYHLDEDLNFKSMDDVSMNDLRHFVDYFNNSHWNPTIGDTERFLGKSVPALLIPDLSTIHKHGEPESGPHHRHEIAICRKLEMDICPMSQQTVPARLHTRQACFHMLCHPYFSPVPEMCLNGYIWQTFLLGPLLLGLPWVGRNAVIADMHKDQARDREPWPWTRWALTEARYLCQAVRCAAGFLCIDCLDIADALIVFHAFGQEIDPLHVEAYNRFMDKNHQHPEIGRPYSKAEFEKFWVSLVLDAEDTTGFNSIPSPYHVAAESQCVLKQPMEEMLDELQHIFSEGRLPAQFRASEKFLFKEHYRVVRWAIPPSGTPHSDSYALPDTEPAHSSEPGSTSEPGPSTEPQSSTEPEPNADPGPTPMTEPAPKPNTEPETDLEPSTDSVPVPHTEPVPVPHTEVEPPQMDEEDGEVECAAPDANHLAMIASAGLLSLQDMQDG